jgi:hypothetical protein
MKSRMTAVPAKFSLTGLLTLFLVACGGGGGEDPPAPPPVGGPAQPTVTAPAISTQPSSVSVDEGQTAAFSVNATGSAPLAYQWKRNGGDISGATSASYSFNAALTDDGSNFTVTVTNSAGSVTSAQALLTVAPVIVAPAITQQPTDASANEGDNVTLNVTATGTAPLAYQWQRNGVDIVGATNSSYSLTVVASDAGAQFTVTVSNTAGSVISATATLSVTLAGPERPRRDGVIFLRDNDLYLVRTDGSRLVRLTNSPETELLAGVAPDGHILYTRPTGTGELELRSVWPDGSHDTLLVAGRLMFRSIELDDKVFFEMTQGGVGGTSDLFVINADGTGLTQLGASPDNDHYEGVHATATETRVLYRTFPATSDDNNILSVRIDGSETRTLADSTDAELPEGISADGHVLYRRLVRAAVHTNDAHLYSIPIDGSAPAIELGGGSDTIFGSLLPDATGNRLVFARAGDLFAVNVDGTNEVLLTGAVGSEARGGYGTPDGKVLFDRGTGTPSSPFRQLWIVDADGTNPLQLTGIGTNESHRLLSTLPTGWVIYSVMTTSAPLETMLHAVRTDGTGLATLWDLSGSTPGFADATADGRIIFSTDTGSGFLDYYSINPDGTDLRPLVESVYPGSYGGSGVDAVSNSEVRIVLTQKMGSQIDLISLSSDGRNGSLLMNTPEEETFMGIF